VTRASRSAPSERGSDWFANESLDLRGHLRPAAGLVLDYSHRPLVIEQPDGSTSSSLVGDPRAVVGGVR
jgi:streptogramin lyase